MKKRLPTIILLLALLAGLSLLLYPTVSNYINQFHQSRDIGNYVENVAGLSEEEIESQWAAAAAFNEETAERSDPFSMTQEQESVYDELLNVSGTGIMGYIEIPSIDCDLPIYHGTNSAVLQRAIGHIEWSSLPVGGESSHCVLSGHRGLPSAKLFTNLDQLQTGDIFRIRVLNETLTYEVDQILTVLPEETADLAVISGEDLCTLVTCTPYGINTHRLLVRGHRISNDESAGTIRVTSDAMQIEPLVVAPIAGIPILVLLVIWLLATDKKARTHRGKKA